MKEKKFVRVCVSLDAVSYEKLSRLSSCSGVPYSQIVRGIILRSDDSVALYHYLDMLKFGVNIGSGE